MCLYENINYDTIHPLSLWVKMVQKRRRMCHLWAVSYAVTHVVVVYKYTHIHLMAIYLDVNILISQYEKNYLAAIQQFIIEFDFIRKYAQMSKVPIYQINYLQELTRCLCRHIIARWMKYLCALLMVRLWRQKLLKV